MTKRLTAQPLEIGYTNYRGEWSMRRIKPISVRWGATEWHPEPGWLMLADDMNRDETREFAMKNFGPEKVDRLDADILSAAVQEFHLYDQIATADERSGRRLAIRGLMVRLGLYSEFQTALYVDRKDESE